VGECVAISSLNEQAQRLRKLLRQASDGLVERDALVELIALAAVAEEHLLVIGPPGTAKSEAVRRVSRTLGANYFEYLLGRFTEPSELFGPINLKKLREGVVESEIKGMLPEAEIAFLDEVFLGSTAILNTLLGILNERSFRRGHSTISCPLRVCVGASNALPEESALAAFADRFLLRIFVQEIADTRLEELLDGGWKSLQKPVSSTGNALEDLDALVAAARRCDLSEVRPWLAQGIRELRKAGVQLSDRRVVKSQRLIAAAAALSGRTSASIADLWPIVYAVPSQESQEIAREALRDLLGKAENETLKAAAEEASHGPAARASRLVEAAKGLLEVPPTALAPERYGWQLKLEGILREIDASFAKDSLPENLGQIRLQISKIVQDPSASN
jgi:MoxR-like ATPase